MSSFIPSVSSAFSVVNVFQEEEAMSKISQQVGTKLLFENDRVRVWDLALAPGESTGVHRHASDYFFVTIGGGLLQGADEDGKKGDPREMGDGEVHWRSLEGQDAIHEAINIGDEPWRNIVVEMLK